MRMVLKVKKGDQGERGLTGAQGEKRRTWRHVGGNREQRDVTEKLPKSQLLVEQTAQY